MSDSQEMFPPEKQPQDAKGAGSLSLPKTKLEVLGSITKYASFIVPTAFGLGLLSVWAYLQCLGRQDLLMDVVSNTVGVYTLAIFCLLLVLIMIWVAAVPSVTFVGGVNMLKDREHEIPPRALGLVLIPITNGLLVFAGTILFANSSNMQIILGFCLVLGLLCSWGISYVVMRPRGKDGKRTHLFPCGTRLFLEIIVGAILAIPGWLAFVATQPLVLLSDWKGGAIANGYLNMGIIIVLAPLVGVVLMVKGKVEAKLSIIACIVVLLVVLTLSASSSSFSKFMLRVAHFSGVTELVTSNYIVESKSYLVSDFPGDGWGADERANNGFSLVGFPAFRFGGVLLLCPKTLLPIAKDNLTTFARSSRHCQVFNKAELLRLADVDPSQVQIESKKSAGRPKTDDSGKQK